MQKPRRALSHISSSLVASSMPLPPLAPCSLLLVCCKIPNLFYLISVLFLVVFFCFPAVTATASGSGAGSAAAYFPLCKIYAINAPPTHEGNCLASHRLFLPCLATPPSRNAPLFEYRVTCRTQLGAFVVIVIVVNVAQRQYRICIFLCQHRHLYIQKGLPTKPLPIPTTQFLGSNSTTKVPSPTGKFCAFLLNFICIGFARLPRRVLCAELRAFGILQFAQ